jgi:ubiquinone biosynthesis protein
LQVTPDRSTAELERLEFDVTELIEEYTPSHLRDVDVGALLRRLSGIVVEHRLRMVPGFFLLLKALVTLEGVGRTLDPNFDLIGQLGPFVKKMMNPAHQLKFLPLDLYFTLMEVSSLLRDMPFELRDMTRVIKSGGLRIQFEHRGLEPALLKHEQVVDKLVFSIVLAALIIGSSLMVHAGIPPKFYGIPVIGLLGFTLAALIGFWLLFQMLRKKRM